MSESTRESEPLSLKIDTRFDAIKGDDKMNKASPGSPQSSSKIFSVVAFYWVSSLSVVFLNKAILSSSEYHFPYPLLITWYQLLVALVLLIFFGKFGRHSGVKVLSMIPQYEFDKQLALKIAPLTVIYVLMLSFNNYCLKYVQVTFYQVARSLTILFNIALTYLILGKTTSSAALIACSIVFFGFVLGSYGEIDFSWIGVFYGVGASFFVALYGIYVKKTLVFVDNDQWRLLHYNTSNALIIMIPFILFSGEVEDLLKGASVFSEFPFWLLMTFTGVTGFLINIAMFLQIKVTTPLSSTISGTAKACVQTILAWMIWRNEITATNGFGIFLTLFGSGLYSYVRYKEMGN